MKQNLFKHFVSRREFIATSQWAVSSMLLGPPLFGEKNLKELISRAGSTEDDQERHGWLLDIADHLPQDAVLQAQIQHILQYSGPWVFGRKQALENLEQEPEHQYLNRFYRDVVKGNPFQHQVPEDSPLFPLWCIYKGRMLIHHTIEISDIRGVKEAREKWYGEGRRLLTVAQEAFPQNQMLGLYFNRPVPWTFTKQSAPAAPDWAVHQRESLEKLREVIHWWVDHRQLPNGEYGGGWNDDVEMWRRWVPVLLAFEDEKSVQAQELLSTRLLTHPRLAGGYVNHITDVEHSSEEISDVLTPMMHLKPKEALWKQKVLRLAELMRQQWMGVNEQGQLQFKSAYFSQQEIDITPQKACDTFYHFRLAQPLFLYWQRSNDQPIGELLTQWLDTWLAASMREERGKPAGIIPNAIHWPDGKVGGTGEQWWVGEHYPSPIYDWPGPVSYIAYAFLLAYHQTGSRKYLEPIKKMAEIRLNYLSNPPEHEPEAGSLAWCAAHLGSFLPGPLAKYRMLTGDTSYDAILKKDADGYIRYRLSGDIADFEEHLRFLKKAFDHNRARYTSEVRNTDRVFAFDDYYLTYYYENVPSARALTSLLGHAVSGEVGSPGYFPMNAVRWLMPPTNLAVLVTGSGADHFAAQVFHFGNQVRTVLAELYLLKKGKYLLRVQDNAGKTLTSSPVDISADNKQIQFQVPPQVLVTVEIKKS